MGNGASRPFARRGAARPLAGARFLALVFLVGAAGAVATSHILARRITRPLQRLVDATGKWESDAGDWDYKADRSEDEIAELASKFAQAAQSLNRQRRELLAARDELTALNTKLEQEVERRTGELMESRERYRLLVEGSPDAFVLIEGSRFGFVNPAFEEIFEYPQDKALQENFRWTQIIHPNFHRVTRERFRAAEEEARPFRMEVVGLTRTGRPINLEIRGRGVEFGGKAVLELILTDVTEKRRLLGQVVQSERLRAMGEMTAMVAHHFNNLLAVMMGRCQLLQMRTQDEQIRSGLAMIQASALKAGEMLRHLQEYYGEQVDLRFGEVDVNALLRELTLYQENLWRTTRAPDEPLLSIKLDLNPLPAVRGSDPLLQDVFHRILINASEAMPQGGDRRPHRSPGRLGGGADRRSGSRHAGGNPSSRLRSVLQHQGEADPWPRPVGRARNRAAARGADQHPERGGAGYRGRGDPPGRLADRADPADGRATAGFGSSDPFDRGRRAAGRAACRSG